MSRLWAVQKAQAVTGSRCAVGEAESHSWAAGHAAGLAAGRAACEAEFAADRLMLATLASSLEALEPVSDVVLTEKLTALARGLAERCIGNAAIDAELLTARARACIAALDEEADAPTLYLHPDDIALIEDACFDMTVAADAGLPRGSVRAERGPAWSADGIAEALARL